MPKSKYTYGSKLKPRNNTVRFLDGTVMFYTVHSFVKENKLGTLIPSRFGQLRVKMWIYSMMKPFGYFEANNFFIQEKDKLAEILRKAKNNQGLVDAYYSWVRFRFEGYVQSNCKESREFLCKLCELE